MVAFTESGFQFSFGGQWSHVHQWDELPAFKRGLQQLSSASAVDFIGLHGADFYLIEVKSFRDHRIENKAKFTSGALATTVADKVRDTIAGLVWAMAREHDFTGLAQLVREVFVVRRKCKVVFWLAEDPQRRPADRSALAEAIKQRLGWLKPHVIVLSPRDPPLPGLAVVGASPGRGASE